MNRWIWTLGLGCMAVLTACSADQKQITNVYVPSSNPGDDTLSVSQIVTIVVAPSSATQKAGTKLHLTVKCLNRFSGQLDCLPEWTSDKPGVISVVNDTVLFLSPGTSEACASVPTTGNSRVKGCGTYTTITPPPSPTSSVVSVQVRPGTWTAVMGGVTSFTAEVITTGDASTEVTWSLSDTSCGMLASSGLTATVTWSKPCLSVMVKATSDFDPSKISSSIGNVTAGTFSCTFVSNVGMQADGSITLAVNQTATLVSTCVNEGGIILIPRWYSSDPNKVRVAGSEGIIVIAGVSYPMGKTATIRADNKGEATITMQAALLDQTVLFRRLVRVQ
ncbi:MAG: hypothetical protein ABIF06_02075 [bacterium]